MALVVHVISWLVVAVGAQPFVTLFNVQLMVAVPSLAEVTELK